MHRLPPQLVVLMGMMNLVYASYSGTLAALASSGRMPRRRAIDVLIVANTAWAVACAALLLGTWSSASALGSAHLALEGAFVATLAALERRYVRPTAR